MAGGSPQRLEVAGDIKSRATGISIIYGKGAQQAMGFGVAHGLNENLPSDNIIPIRPLLQPLHDTSLQETFNPEKSISVLPEVPTITDWIQP